MAIVVGKALVPFLVLLAFTARCYGENDLVVRSSSPEDKIRLKVLTDLAAIAIPKFDSCRDEVLSDFVDVNKLRLNVGDLVEFERGENNTWLISNYHHWAIHTGDDIVCHLQGEYQAALGSILNPSLDSITDSLLDPNSTQAVVKCEHLKNAARGSKARINNKVCAASMRGLHPLPMKTIHRQVKRVVGENIRYSLVSANCEHFVTEMKYGVGWSDQVDELRRMLAKVGLAAFATLAFS